MHASGACCEHVSARAAHAAHGNESTRRSGAASTHRVDETEALLVVPNLHSPRAFAGRTRVSSRRRAAIASSSVARRGPIAAAAIAAAAATQVCRGHISDGRTICLRDLQRPFSAGFLRVHTNGVEHLGGRGSGSRKPSV